MPRSSFANTQYLALQGNEYARFARIDKSGIALEVYITMNGDTVGIYGVNTGVLKLISGEHNKSIRFYKDDTYFYVQVLTGIAAIVHPMYRAISDAVTLQMIGTDTGGLTPVELTQ